MVEGLALGAVVGVNVGEAVSMQTATILKSVTPIDCKKSFELIKQTKNEKLVIA